MTPLGKAILLSVSVHATLFACGIAIGRHSAAEPQPMIIDLSLALAEAAIPAPASTLTQEPPSAAPAVEKHPKEPSVLQPPEPLQPQKKPQNIKQPKQKIKKTPLNETPVLPKQQQLESVTKAAIETESTSAVLGNPPDSDDPIEQVFATAKESKGEPEHPPAIGRAIAGYPSNSRYDFASIRELIVSHLSFPSAARRMGMTGKIIVSFLLIEDGGVENIHVVQSSGYAMLDDHVVNTIRTTAPFPKPPARVQLVLPIVFHLK